MNMKTLKKKEMKLLQHRLSDWGGNVKGWSSNMKDTWDRVEFRNPIILYRPWYRQPSAWLWALAGIGLGTVAAYAAYYFSRKREKPASGSYQEYQGESWNGEPRPEEAVVTSGYTPNGTSSAFT